MKNIVCIIPARSGSKGIKDKNILNLGGHPLIAWSITTAKQSKLINRIIVSTDSKKYQQISLDYGAEVPFLRPSNISKDDSTDLEFFKHVLDFLKKDSYSPDLFVHLRPTTPLRDSLVVDKAIKNFDKEKYTSLRSVHKLNTPIHKTFKIENNQLVSFVEGDKSIDKFNEPRQKFIESYQANGYVDIVNPNFIIQTNLLHGDKCKAFITERTYDIDEENDFKDLEYIVMKEKLTLPK
jgi:CMP-N,N'-diacetyllegionaminic acid synthase